MKLVIVAVLAFAALSQAAPQNKEAAVEPPKILRSEFDQQPNGNYNFNFETEDGIKRSETGELKQVNNEENKPQDVVVVRGSYTYLDENQKEITINYYADETGFHAEGDSIPKQQR